jgi:hypothetical protein
MKLQKKHIIYGGILAAALLAWGVDAMFFEPSSTSSPETAAAASLLPSNAPSGPSVAATAAKAFEPQWLSRKLRDWSANNLVDPQNVRDAFALPSSWSWLRSAAPTTAPAARPAEDFGREHHLTAVMVSGKNASALVDGRLLRIGESIGGCRLIEASKGRADFITPDGTHFHLLIGPEEKSEK